MPQKKISPPVEMWRNFSRKFHLEKRRRSENELPFTFDEYNREISSSTPSSSSPTFKFYVTPKSVVPISLLSPRKCSEISLRCQFLNMKRRSTKESFGFVFSPLAKLTTGTTLVDTVYSNSPAETSGLLPGDRIMTVNGKRLDNKTDVDGLMKDVLDLELTVARIQRVSIDEAECDQTTSDKLVDPPVPNDDLKNSCEIGSDSEKESKERKCVDKYPETDEEFRHRYSWGTGTIIDRYPEARAMLRMLGRGPYSDDLRDYSCHY